MRLIDADELIEHAWRDKLDSRELIVQMIATAPTIKEITTKIPIHIFERLLEQEPFINKPCVSSGICEHDKNKVLDKIRAEITAIAINGQVDEHTMFIRAGGEVKQMALDIIDKYKAEIEPQESEE